MEVIPVQAIGGHICAWQTLMVHFPNLLATLLRRFTALHRILRTSVNSLLATVLGFSLVSPSTLGAQTKKPSDSPDQKEYSAYVLTMDKIHRLADATKELKK